MKYPGEFSNINFIIQERTDYTFNLFVIAGKAIDKYDSLTQVNIQSITLTEKILACFGDRPLTRADNFERTC